MNKPDEQDDATVKNPPPKTVNPNPPPKDDKKSTYLPSSDKDGKIPLTAGKDTDTH